MRRVAVPESAVEYLGEAGLERGGEFGRERPVADGVRGLAVTLRTAAHVLRAARPPLYLEDLHPGLYHLVHKFDRAEVLRRHYVFIVNIQLSAGFEIGNLVAPAANLVAGSAVG